MLYYKKNLLLYSTPQYEQLGFFIFFTCSMAKINLEKMSKMDNCCKEFLHSAFLRGAVMYWHTSRKFIKVITFHRIDTVSTAGVI